MPDIEALVRIYRTAGRDLRSMVLSVDPENYRPYDVTVAMIGVQKVVTRLKVETTEWTEQAVDRAYNKGGRTARTILEVLGKEPKGPQIITRGYKIKQDLATTLIRANGSIVALASDYLTATGIAARAITETKTLLREFSYDEVRDDMDRMARTAVRREATQRELAGKVRARLRSYIGNDEFIMVNGRRYEARAYSELVARTTLREAQTAATLDLCQLYDNDLVQWSEHGTQCQDCAYYEGQIYSISGRHPVYPMLTESPPLHPNCEHSLLPTSDIAIARQPAAGSATKGLDIEDESIRAGLAKVKKAPKSEKLGKAKPKTQYRSAKTIKEAEDWARANVANSVDYSGMDLKVANAMNKELSYLAERGVRVEMIGTLDDVSMVVGDPGHLNTVMTVWREDKKGQVNAFLGWNKGSMRSWETFGKTASRSHRVGLQIGVNRERMIQHEIGHIIDFLNPGGPMRNELYDELFRRITTPFARETALFNARQLIGSYGFSGNRVEWFAELYRAYRQDMLPSDWKWVAEFFKRKGF